MPTPPDLETPFRRRARRLPSPASGQFDPTTWTDAFTANSSSATAGDRGLLDAALWTGREVGAHTASLPEPFRGLSAAQAVLLGVAALNLQFIGSQRAARAQRDALDPDALVSFDYLSHLPYANDDGQELSQNDFGETGVEALESWLYDANAIRSAETEVPPSAETIHSLTGAALRFYSLRKVLKGQFDKALFQGARLQTGERDHWEPHDRDLARLQHAWHARSESDVLTAAMNVRAEWPSLGPVERRKRMPSRTVTRVQSGANGSRLKVARRECLSRKPPYQVIDRRAMEDSYLNCFIDEEMPLAPGLSVALLAAAWWVIGDAVRLLVRLAQQTPQLRTAAGYAAAVRRSELVGAVASALGIATGTADAAISFLTFGEEPRGDEAPADRPSARGRHRKGQRGLWAAPLVPVPGEDHLALPLTVFEIGSFMYRAEAWLERGGIDDDAMEHRGDRYEADLRRRCAEAIDGNPTFRTSRAARNGIARSATFPHQIDLLLLVGRRVLVAEVKCLLTPADPHQWDRFLREKLPDAARQANVRAAALRDAPEVLESALGLTPGEAGSLKVQPIVVLNIGAGFSLLVEGCRVVHADFLLAYLRGPVMESGAAVHRDDPMLSRLVTLYESERDAGDRFDDAMADPWPLRRFLDRLTWQETEYPRPTGGRFAIGSPARGNLTPVEQRRFRSLIEAADAGFG